MVRLAMQAVQVCLNGGCERNTDACNAATQNYDQNKMICIRLYGGVQESVPQTPYYGSATQTAPPPPPPPPSLGSQTPPERFFAQLGPMQIGYGQFVPGGYLNIPVDDPDSARSQPITETLSLNDPRAGYGPGPFAGGTITGRVAKGTDGQDYFHVEALYDARGNLGPYGFDIPQVPY
jgi:hypothetical protein